MSIKNIQTAHLVHDLKNPINIIETGARSLLEKQDRYGSLNPKQEKVILRMLRNALKLRHLANNMLEVDMASLGVLHVENCSLSKILRTALVEVFDLVDPVVSDAIEGADCFDEFVSILKANDILLEADERLLERQISIDETKMVLIVTNLLSNAFKYRNRLIHVRVSITSDSIELAVKDDGPGIPEYYHQKIFDSYFQCEKIEDFPVRGHGLGLAGALALADAMGGTLSICKSPNGAEFVVNVKLCPKP
ncbi:MAG: sensor histidine kinase [Desulfomonilaceae bacterium]